MTQFPSIIVIPKHSDLRGNLSVVDSSTCLPFELKRVFYVYDIPADTQRGAHAHLTLHQFLWCISGSISVDTEDRHGTHHSFTLSLPWQGLYLPPLTWASERAITSGSVYAVAASSLYDESDYIRDYSSFRTLIHNNEG